MVKVFLCFLIDGKGKNERSTSEGLHVPYPIVFSNSHLFYTLNVTDDDSVFNFDKIILHFDTVRVIKIFYILKVFLQRKFNCVLSK